MSMTAAFVFCSAFLAVSTQRLFISEAHAQTETEPGLDPRLHVGHEPGPASQPMFDGTVRADDIPDGVAISVLMHTLRVSAEPDEAALNGLQARVAALSLSDSDLEVLVRKIGDFDTAARDQEARIEAVRPSGAANISAASARFVEDRYIEEQKNLSTLIESRYQLLLESLSPEGAAKLHAHLQRVKSRIRIYPPPDMSKRTL